MYIYCGSIVKFPFVIGEKKYYPDAIINASNGIGIMGAGVAGVIQKASGGKITDFAIDVCKRNNLEPGMAFVTEPGDLPVKKIIHAITMKYPGSLCDSNIIPKCLSSIFNAAKTYRCKLIAIPGLGLGVGRADPDIVAVQYQTIIPKLEKEYGIDAIICDININFIKKL